SAGPSRDGAATARSSPAGSEALQCRRSRARGGVCRCRAAVSARTERECAASAVKPHDLVGRYPGEVEGEAEQVAQRPTPVSAAAIAGRRRGAPCADAGEPPAAEAASEVDAFHQRQRGKPADRAITAAG